MGKPMIGVEGELFYVNSAHNISTKAVKALVGKAADDYGALILHETPVANGAILGKIAIRDGIGDAAEAVLGYRPSDKWCVRLRNKMNFDFWRKIPVTFPGSVETVVASHVAAVQEGQGARGQAQRGNLRQFR